MEPSVGDEFGSSGAQTGRTERKERGNVRKAILSSAETIFQGLVTELKELSSQLEFAIKHGATEGPFRSILAEWMDAHADLIEARDQWSTLLDPGEYDKIQNYFIEVFTGLANTKRRAVNYIDVLLSRSAEESQIIALQEEVNQLKAELEKSRSQNTPMSGISEPRATSSKIPLPPEDPAPTFSHWTPDNKRTESVLNVNAPEFRPPITPVIAAPPPLPPPPDPTLKSVFEMMLKAQKAERLPEVKPTVFEGNVLDFPMWWNTFRVFVENKTECPHERLNILGQFTKGEALTAILPSLNKAGDEGAYEEAKNILKSRFGDKLKLSAAYRDKLRRWPKIQGDDAHGLRAYSDFLWQCESVRDTAGYLGNLDSAEENLKFVAKLPKDLVRRWNRVATKKICGASFDSLAAAGSMQYEEFPKFSEFCSFVAEEARIADGPCMSSISEPQPEKGQKYRHPYRRAGTMKTNTSEAVSECAYCSAKHHISACNDFLSLPYDDKKALVTEKHLCYGCLRTGHGVRTCSQRNPKLMNRPRKATSMNTGVSSALGCSGEDEHFSSMIVQAWITHASSPNKRIKTYVVMDSQSDACFVTPQILNQFDVAQEPVTLELSTMNTVDMIDTTCTKGFMLQGLDMDTAVRLPGSYKRENIPVNRSHIPRPEMTDGHRHLRKLREKIPGYDPKVPVGVLVGYNCPSAMLPLEVKSKRGTELYGVKTELGWSLVGKVKSGAQRGRKSTSLFTRLGSSVMPVTTEDFRKAFDCEFTQPGDTSFVKRSQEDQQFVRIMEEGIRFQSDGHIELPLPVRETHEKLPDSRKTAYGRAMSLKRKFERDPKFKSEYVEFMEKMVARGWAELVDEDDEVDGWVWYLPHQGVYHPKKTDKPVRPVWDGAAETDGVSLNSLLMTGPDMGNHMTGVLIRFREEENAFTSDVEKMFMQVMVPVKQRDLMRYFWWPEGDTSKPPKVYRLKIHMFGASSSPACAMYAFKAVAEKYGNEFSPEVVEFIKRNFYVDDGCGSQREEQKAVEVMLESHRLCSKGGFNLREYASNNLEAIKKVPEPLRAEDMNKWIKGEPVEPRLTLGMLWNFVTDCLQYVFQIPKKEFTRRGMLSCLSSLYDPLGLVSPAVLPGRMILQELCRMKYRWDQPVEEPFLGRWKTWFEQIREVSQISIPRRFRRSVHPDLVAALRVFGDACTTGLGVCLYLILTDPEGNEDRSLVAAKSRVGPLKHVTVPRLELQASVLEEAVEAELPYVIEQVDYFSDSKSALGYIYNESKRVQLFVVNRAQKIRNRSHPQQWHHVDTDQNPADLASRGATVEELKNSELYWKGPDSAYIKEKCRPQEFPIEDNDPELKKEKRSLATLARENWLLNKFSVHSKLSSILRACIIVRRCVAALARNKLKDRKRKLTVQQKLNTITELTLNHSVEEKERALEVLVKKTQELYFHDTLKAMLNAPAGTDRQAAKGRKFTVRSQSTIYKLDPIIGNDGLLRVGGRLRNSEFPETYVHPALLPSKGFLTRAIVESCHEMAKHSGRNISLNMIRANGWWVIGGKAMVDRVLKNCVLCRRLRGPLECQKMANLPAERVTPAPPFTHSGADFLGPYTVKERRSLCKRYLCLFTCMVSKAIHLEVSDDMSTSSFAEAYRRFACRRGPIKSLHTDRGTNFVGFNNERTRAQASLDLEVVRNDPDYGCEVIIHRFNTPQAPHQGGAWERLVGVVKSVLDPVLVRYGERLNTQSLRTVAAEVEAVVNSRPITVPDMSDASSMPALTPSQLLTGKVPGLKPPPPGDFPEEDVYAREQWKRAHAVSQQFWFRWRREYLPLLQERHKWERAKPNLEVGDIVILHDDSTPRMKWPMGRIVEVKSTADDGLIRSVTVKTATGRYERPVNKMVLLYRPDCRDSSPVEEPALV